MRAHFYLPIIVLITSLSCFSCDSSGESDDTNIYNLLTNALYLGQSSVNDGALPAGNADTAVPQISTFNFPDTVVFQTPNTVTITTDYADASQISKLYLQIEGATQYLSIVLPFTAGNQTSTSSFAFQLVEDSAFAGKQFMAKFALTTASGAVGEYKTATFTIAQISSSCPSDQCCDATGTPLQAGTNCDDGNQCTTEDACTAAGECTGTAINCGENASCEASNGTCSCNTGYEWDGEACVLSGSTDGDVLPDGDTDGDIIDGDEDPIDGDDDEDLSAPSFICDSRNYPMQKGVNSNFQSAGSNREFTIILPDDTSLLNSNLPIIFYFHGSGDSMSNWANNMGIQNMANRPEFPFIAIVPKSLQLQPSMSKIAFDWDCLQFDSNNPGANLDTNLFIDILTCMKEGFNIDEDRVHIMGFSAGAIMTDLISVAHSEQIASIAAFSGAYFSDQTQQECIYGLCAQWTPYNSSNKFPAFINWGGSADTYDLGGYLTFDFASTAQKTITYLNNYHHDVVSCDNGGGHTFNGTALSRIYPFFKAHPRGTINSPYAAGLPDTFSTCNFHVKQ